MAQRMALRLSAVFCTALAVLFVSGCSESKPDKTESEAESRIPLAPSEPKTTSIAELRAQLGANENAKFHKSSGEIFKAELGQSGVTSLKPLRGVPLRELDLFGLRIKDLSPLAGMPLEILFLDDTPVNDLSALAGLQLKELYARDTQVVDLAPLAGMPLKKLNVMNCPVENIDFAAKCQLNTLWIPGTKVTDLTPLATCHLESLDLQDTPASDLLVLKGMQSLRRLNIAGSQVSDLSPLEGLQLQRLVFSPDKIKTGIEIARNMASIQEIGATFETRTPPAQFWQKYDAGEFREQPPAP